MTSPFLIIEWKFMHTKHVFRAAVLGCMSFFFVGCSSLPQVSMELSIDSPVVEYSDHLTAEATLEYSLSNSEVPVDGYELTILEEEPGSYEATILYSAPISLDPQQVHTGQYVWKLDGLPAGLNDRDESELYMTLSDTSGIVVAESNRVEVTYSVPTAK